MRRFADLWKALNEMLWTRYTSWRAGQDSLPELEAADPAVLEARALTLHIKHQETQLRSMVPPESRPALEMLLEESRLQCEGNPLQALVIASGQCVRNGWITKAQRDALDLLPPRVLEAEEMRNRQAQARELWDNKWQRIMSQVKVRALKKGNPNGPLEALAVWNQGPRRRYDDRDLAEFRRDLKRAGLL